MKLHGVVLGLALAASTVSTSAAKGLTVDDMLAMQRVGAPVVSPDGKRVVFAVRDTDVEANRGRFDLYLANVDGSGTARRMTTHAENDTDPAWSVDGKSIYFVSTRSGSAQVWRLSESGGEAEQVTKLPLDINGFAVHPDGKRLVLAVDVWPTAKMFAESVKIDDAKAKTKSKMRAYDSLLFRHWDQWEDGRYSHLFMWSPDKADDAKDLTPGQATDAPTHPFGGMEEIDVSPDGKTLLFVTRTGGKEVAWKTNTDVFALALDGNTKPVNLTSTLPGYDFSPTWSPDGKTIAFKSMKRAGFEADRERLIVIDWASKKQRVVTEAWDRSVGEIAWSTDGKTVFTSSDNLGHHAVFAIDVASGAVKELVSKGTNTMVTVAGDRLVYGHDGLTMPVELFTAKLDGSDQKQLTHFNDARVKAITWGAGEQFTFKGAKGDTVYGWAIRPAGHDGKTKVPLAFLIHGGPQGSFGDHFHYRWNPQSYAGRGYGVVMIDFHGSTGYGQAFTDAISNDWAGAPYEDLMKGLDEAIKKYTWIDGSRVAALGASYGGFMINWINGHTDRFKALVCHDGNLDERMAYYDTEELWFPEWEHGGTPHEKPEGYLKHNPIDYVKNWKTPTLVIHGALDYRVVDAHGMSTFTALQRKGVPSRFLHFPDENHWVLKPQNSKAWHIEVLAWLDKYTKR